MSTPNHERMSSVDTAWLRMDTAVNCMMIVGVTITATPIPVTRFRRVVKDRLLEFPRFRQRPVLDPLGASWVEDEAFDLDAHVKEVTLAEPGGKAELEGLAATLASTRLDARRPLWQLHLVRRYGAGSAWIMRVHHCYADGMAMLRVLLTMTDGGKPDGGAAASSKRRRRAFDLPLLGWLGQIAPPAMDAFEYALTGGVRLVESGLRQTLHPEHAAVLARHAGGIVGELARVLALPDDPPTPLRGALCGAKAVAWAEPLPLAAVKAVGRALGCTVNDVLMSTVAGALGSHLREAGHDTTGLSVRATVPVNLRAKVEPISLGNRFGLMFVDMPLGVTNPLQRLYAMHTTMASLKGSMQPPMTLLLLGLMGMLPAAVQTSAIELFSRKGSAVVSNLPGPQEPLFFCGQRITEMFFWVPQSGSMGIGISVLTYAGRVHFGMIADRRLAADPHQVVDRFALEFDQLRRAVTEGIGENGQEPPGTATKKKSGRAGRRAPRREPVRRRGSRARAGSPAD